MMTLQFGGNSRSEGESFADAVLRDDRPLPDKRLKGFRYFPVRLSIVRSLCASRIGLLCTVTLTFIHDLLVHLTAGSYLLMELVIVESFKKWTQQRLNFARLAPYKPCPILMLL